MVKKTTSSDWEKEWSDMRMEAFLINMAFVAAIVIGGAILGALALGLSILLGVLGILFRVMDILLRPLRLIRPKKPRDTARSDERGTARRLTVGETSSRSTPSEDKGNKDEPHIRPTSRQAGEALLEGIWDGIARAYPDEDDKAAE